MASLTPEQKKAYRELEDAIEGVLRARGIEGLLVEHMVIAAVQQVDDEGDMLTSVRMLLPQNGGVPYHRAIGLVNYVETVLRAEVARNELGADDADD